MAEGDGCIMVEGDAVGNEQGMSPMSYWVCKVCPAAEDCTEKAFKRAQCWGWTLGECKSRVYKHLHTSGMHQTMLKEDRRILTEEAEYESCVYEAEPSWNDDGEVMAPEAVAPQTPKRPREPAGPPPLGMTSLKGKGKGKGKGKSKGKSEDQVQIMSHVPWTTAAASSGDNVTFTVSTLDLILDTIERARSGIEHARTILESGALAFNREKANLDAASEMISAIKRRR